MRPNLKILRNLRKDLAATQEFLKEMESCEVGPKQPDGFHYHHGERITRHKKWKIEGEIKAYETAIALVEKAGDKPLKVNYNNIFYPIITYI